MSCVTLGIVAIAISGMAYLSRTNDLGLTGFDAVMGGHSEMEALRANSRAAADSFLTEHRNELADLSQSLQEIAVDYSKSRMIRAQGYKSSFYYYCWDIYLPYSPRPQFGKIDTVLVHLSDAVAGHGHDSRKFYVVDVRLLDRQGNPIQQFSY